MIVTSLRPALVLLSVFGIACGQEPAQRLDSGVPDETGDSGVADGGSLDAITSSQAVGWTQASHGHRAEPDYAAVFPNDVVNRIDLEIHPDHWKAMQADLEEVTGTGEAPAYFDQLLNRMEAACANLSDGAACEVEIRGALRSGTCINFSMDDLACDVGTLDTIPCEGKEVGAACIDIFFGEDGQCHDTEFGVACFGDGGGFGNPDYAAADFWNGRKPAYVPCMLKMDDKTWPHVGVRYKGNNSLASSLEFQKKPLRLKFDAFETERPEIHNQRFYGFQHLSLGNNVVDQPYLRQRTAAALFAAGGVPSPAVAFYRVFVDYGEGPIYWGLYTMTEIVDDPMLARTFGSTDGNLYKPDGRGAIFAEYVEVSYHKKNNKMEADFSDMMAFVQALNASPEDRATWRTNLELTFDMVGFVQFWAANQAIANWDTYGGFAHNFYLYADPNDRSALKFLPWDFDLSLEGTGSEASMLNPDSFHGGMFEDEWPLLEAIAFDPVYRMEYDAQLALFETAAFNGQEVEDQVAGWHALIRPYVVGSEGELEGVSPAPSAETFDAGLTLLTEHLRLQKIAVREYLESR